MNIAAHHQQGLDAIIGIYGNDPRVLGLLLTGSIAHGLANDDSDIDFALVVSEEEYQQRSARGELTCWHDFSSIAPGLYGDGKIVCLSFMRSVAAKGSEPARFAFADAVVIKAKSEEIAELVAQISQYPLARQQENIRRFAAQFETWAWYCGEALKKQNRYLLGHSVQNLVLFAGRMILAQNQQLFPYHKWFLAMLERCTSKPENLLADIDSLLAAPDSQRIEAFCQTIRSFCNSAELAGNWPHQFLLDSELNWLDGHTPVADL